MKGYIQHYCLVSIYVTAYPNSNLVPIIFSVGEWRLLSHGNIPWIWTNTMVKSDSDGIIWLHELADRCIEGKTEQNSTNHWHRKLQDAEGYYYRYVILII